MLEAQLSQQGAGLTAFFAAFVIQLFFLGCTFCQSCLYFVTNSDGWRTRAFVSTLLALSVVSAFLIGQTVYVYTIIDDGNPSAIKEWTPTAIANNQIIAVAAFLCQLFFAIQVHGILGRRKLIPSIIIGFAVASLGCSIVVTVLDSILKDIAASIDLLPRLFSTLCGVFGTISDIVASFAMFWYLNTQRVDNDLKRTHVILRFLIILTVNRAVLVTIVQFTWVMLFVLTPTNLRWIPFYLSLNSLYINTALAMLNSRPALRANVSKTPYFHVDTTFTSMPITLPTTPRTPRENGGGGGTGRFMGSFRGAGERRFTESSERRFTSSNERRFTGSHGNGDRYTHLPPRMESRMRERERERERDAMERERERERDMRERESLRETLREEPPVMQVQVVRRPTNVMRSATLRISPKLRDVTGIGAGRRGEPVRSDTVVSNYIPEEDRQCILRYMSVSESMDDIYV